MARLTTKQRNALPSSAFAGPGRSDPINDAAHARAALRLVGRQKGLSTAERKRIKARARAKLAKA